MGKVRLVIAYDGTAYRGWQDNSHAPSIEGALSRGIRTLLQRDIKLEAASRTDAGVHAEGQVVVVDDLNEIDYGRISRSLNHVLPSDISVTDIKMVPDCFHPTLSARGKRYRYSICTQKVQLPLYRKYSWHVPAPLNVEKMEHAAQSLIGEHDFRAFCNQRNDLSYDSFVRTIDSIAISCRDERLLIDVKGHNFLYKMVRNIVGTLAYVGLGKLEVESIPSLLQHRDRRNIGMTAPAHGLSLVEVYY